VSLDDSDGDRRLRVIDEWDGGVGWLVHPEESLRRAGHALRTDAGLWVVDPLDVPGLDDLLAEWGEVTGVAVLSSWHARDAGRVAARHGCPVSLPGGLKRVADRLPDDVAVRRLPGRLGDSDYRLLPTAPLPTWQEAACYRERDGTLLVPESLGTAHTFTVGDERLGVSLYRRHDPPTEFGNRPVERVLVGHGEGVFEDAAAALADALAGSRRRLPRALAAHLTTGVRQLVRAALR